jgi:hypothetical protein
MPNLLGAKICKKMVVVGNVVVGKNAKNVTLKADNNIKTNFRYETR